MSEQPAEVSFDERTPASPEAGASFVRPGAPAELAVVIVNYNTTHVVFRCVAALREACRGLAVRLLIVDNASTDGSSARLRELGEDCILVFNQKNVGFGRANNQLLPLADAPFVLLLNPDAYVTPDAVRLALAYMRAHPRCGVLGSDLLGERGDRGEPRRTFPSPWRSFAAETGLDRLFGATRGPAPEQGAWPCDWVTGCFYLVRREALDAVGGFDPRYFLYFEEVDHCKAVAEAGWTVECLLDAKVVHEGGESVLSSGKRQATELSVESELLYARKHHGLGGVAATAALSWLSDAIVTARCLVRRRSPAAQLHRARLMARSLVETRLGTRPTR